MTEFLLHLGWLTLSMSLVILAVLLWSKLFGKRFSANSRYMVWIVVILTLCLGLGGGKLPSFVTLEIPLPAAAENSVPETLPTADFPAVSLSPSAEGKEPTVPLPSAESQAVAVDEETTGSPLPEAPEKKRMHLAADRMIFTVWLMGALVFFSASLFGYFRISHRYARGKKLCEAETRAILCSLCRRYKKKHIPRIYRCAHIGSPVLLGYRDPTILLPEIPLSQNALVGVLAHELTHYRRGDLWIKLLCLVAESLHWFNPFVYIAAARCNREMELSCDESVLSGMSEAVRRSYGNVMLTIVKHCSRRRSALTTQFNPHKNAVKERILNILDTTRRRRGKGMVLVTLILCLAAGAVIGCTVKEENDRNKTIGEEAESEEFVDLQGDHFAENDGPPHSLEEEEKIIDSIVYVDINSVFSEEGQDSTFFVPISYIKNGVQQINGEMGVYSFFKNSVLSEAPEADALKKENGISSNGTWDFFPVKVEHVEYTWDRQPDQAKWTDYFKEVIPKDTPVIITDVYSFEQDGTRVEVVTASNVIVNGDPWELYHQDSTYTVPNLPSATETEVYIISAVFVGDQEPTALYNISLKCLTRDDDRGISYDPLVFSGGFQQIYSAAQYIAGGEVSVCSIYNNMNGELILRDVNHRPAFLFADIDGDGKVELMEYINKVSSEMSICIIYDDTNDGYERKASIVLS